MTDAIARLRAALSSRGIRDAAAFARRYGVPLRDLTPEAALALVERVPLETLSPPAAITGDAELADNWGVVCALVDLVYDYSPAASVGSEIGERTLSIARRLGYPHAMGEDLWDFARRFDAWARSYTVAARQPTDILAMTGG
jgi:hypothetical protein